MIAVLVSLLGMTATQCTAVSGANRLWAPSNRWVIVGEMHGTNETPEAFSNLVCLASATNRPVTVALEYPADSQSTLNTYLDSRGDERAQSRLLELPIWNSKMQDGRASAAFLRLWDRLRRMKQGGMINGVIASDVGDSTPSVTDRDRSMAKTWINITAPSNGIIIALVGNIHAMRIPLARPNRVIVTAASLLPSKQTVTVNVIGSGGTAWNCQSDGCGPHQNGMPRKTTAGISFSTEADRPWDAIYQVGIPTTAAVPALKSQARPTTLRPTDG